MSRDNSPSWWMWAGSILACYVGTTFYEALEEKPKKDKKEDEKAKNEKSPEDSAKQVIKTKQLSPPRSTIVNILKGIVICILICNVLYVIANIIQAFSGKSPIWWIWAISFGLILMEGTTISYLSSLNLGENPSFLSKLASASKLMVTLIFVFNIYYIIANIVQAFSGKSPVWWIWVASLVAMPLEGVIINGFSSLERMLSRH